MRQSGLSRPAGVLAGLFIFVPSVLLAQRTLSREGDQWVETLTGTAPAAARLRVNCHGPVHLEGGAASEIAYSVKLSVRARNEAAARRLLGRFGVRTMRSGDWSVVTTEGGPVTSILTLQAPRLEAAVISTAEGGVEANGIDGALTADSGAGELKCDRVRGDCRLMTGGGDILVGEAGARLRAATGGGRIAVKSVRGEAALETAGGDIEVGDAGATVRADTAGGSIRVTRAGGSVTASTGGGPIVIGQAGGVVITRNMAGPVQVGAAPGVRSESGTGGVQLSNIAGPIRVSTAIGNIMASLLAGSPLSDSFLATGNGDITVLIPSNLGLTIRAENDLADSIRRIVSDFPGIPVRMMGTQVVAEGPVNGGGPLLRISGTGGTIFIKRQP
ncbi:MAG: hypothetical protein KGM92_14245 [Acidobacteriota bacterium]|jgi:hypothetical protein|nr:hypothetical protein [Acidobacteriota bacterium]